MSRPSLASPPLAKAIDAGSVQAEPRLGWQFAVIMDDNSLRLLALIYRINNRGFSVRRDGLMHGFPRTAFTDALRPLCTIDVSTERSIKAALLAALPDEERAAALAASLAPGVQPDLI